jgi:MYXO-CTERM domain-containing protein
VLIAHASAGGEPAHYNTRAFRVAVSADRASWADVATVRDNVAGETQHTFSTARARFVRLTIDDATQTGEATARIYEVRVHGRCGPLRGADADPGPELAPDDPDTTAAGCGCRTGGGTPGAVFLVLALVVLRRRGRSCESLAADSRVRRRDGS